MANNLCYKKIKKKKKEISAMLSIFNGNVLFSFSSEVEPFTAHTQEYILRIVDARKGTKKIQQMLFSLSPPLLIWMHSTSLRGFCYLP